METEVEIDELDSTTWIISAETESVCFFNLEENLDADHNFRDLASYLQKCEYTENVKYLTIDFYSYLSSCWVCNHFPNLKTVIIRGLRIETLKEIEKLRGLEKLIVETNKNSTRRLDVLPQLNVENLELEISNKDDPEILSRCSGLKSLSLSRWREEDLSNLEKIDLRILILRNSHLSNAVGIPFQIQKTYFFNCKKLVSVSGLNTLKLYIENCNNLDLATLNGVIGMVELDLEIRELKSFSFVKKCESLRKLSIKCKKICNDDFLDIANSHSLSCLILQQGQINTHQIDCLVKKNPNISISISHEIFYLNGIKVNYEEFHKFHKINGLYV